MNSLRPKIRFPLLLALALAGGALRPAGGAEEEAPAPGPEPRAEERALALRSLLREGHAELRAGNPEIAIRSFRAALERSPQSKEARYGLGTAMISARQEREALEILSRLAQEYPNDHFILNNLAWLYATAEDLEIRNGERAVHFARAAMVLQPNDHHVWSTLAESYFVSAAYERALRSAQEALRLARATQAPEAMIENYTRLVERCRATVAATAILEF